MNELPLMPTFPASNEKFYSEINSKYLLLFYKSSFIILLKTIFEKVLGKGKSQKLRIDLKHDENGLLFLKKEKSKTMLLHRKEFLQSHLNSYLT